MHKTPPPLGNWGGFNKRGAPRSLIDKSRKILGGPPRGGLGGRKDNINELLSEVYKMLERVTHRMHDFSLGVGGRLRRGRGRKGLSIEEYIGELQAGSRSGKCSSRYRKTPNAESTYCILT